jgi:hypothetical protein
MAMLLRDVISIHHGPAAVVLQSGLNEPGLANTFIPTHSAIQVLRHLEKAVQYDATQELRAINCYGIYGSGKSRLAVLLGQLLRDGLGDEHFGTLLRRLASQGEGTLANKLRSTFLPKNDVDARPYLVVPMYGIGGSTLQGALVEALYREVRQSTVLIASEILLKTEYVVAEERLAEILSRAPEHSDAYLPSMGLGNDYHNLDNLRNGLKNHEAKALAVFCAWHLKVTLGNPFDAMQHGASHAEEIFVHAAQKLAERNYKGIAIIWDEFGYALEDLLSNPLRAPIREIFSLQTFVQTACAPSIGQILFLGLTHVSLAEYGPRGGADTDLRDRLETIQGRFSSLKIELRPAETEGYHLLAAQIHQKEEGASYRQQAKERINRIANLCRSLPIFSQMGDGMASIVSDCYPMHPLASAGLLALSTRYAAATRTAFTYLSELESKGLLETPIDADGLFGRELVRLPALAEYYESHMANDGLSNVLTSFHMACAQIRGGEATPDQIAERRDVLAVVLLSGILLDGSFQASDDLLAIALHDVSFSTLQAEPLRQALAWLANAGLLWKNEATGFWQTGGDSSVDAESLLRQAEEKIPNLSLVDYVARFSDLFADLMPMLGEHCFDPSPKGIVRRYSISPMVRCPLSAPPIDPAFAAAIHVVITDTPDEAQQFEQKTITFPLSNDFYWFSYENNEELRLKFRQFLALTKLREQIHSEGTNLRLTAKYDGLRQSLIKELGVLYGRAGLQRGTTKIVRQGSPLFDMKVTSWVQFREHLQVLVNTEYAKEISVRSPQKMRNVLGVDAQANSAETVSIVERILEFDSNTAYQTDLLGTTETSETAAVIDGILGANDLFVKRADGWGFRELDELADPIKETVSVIRTEVLKRRPNPYLLTGLAKKLASAPYGIPVSAVPLIVAFALRKDMDRIVWVNGRASAASNICNSLVNTVIGVRVSEFTQYQLNIARILEASLRKLYAAQEKSVDINQGASQARATRSIEVLKELVGSIAPLTLASPKLDPRLRQIADHFTVIGKTQHDLLALLAGYIDPNGALSGPVLTDDLRNSAEDSLGDILSSYRQVEDERKMAAISHIAALVYRVDSHTDRDLLKDQLDLFGEAGAAISEVLGPVPPSEKALENILESYLEKPLGASTEMDVGVAIGKLTSLIDQSEAKAIQVRNEEERQVGIGEDARKFEEDLERVVQEFAGGSGVDLKILPSILGRIAKKLEMKGEDDGGC